MQYLNQPFLVLWAEKTLKILYLHQYFNTPAMSGGTRSYEMARRFVRAGHEVHLISSYRDYDRPAGIWWTEMVEGVHVHWLTVPYSNKLSYTKRIKAFVHFAWAAAGKARRLGGDVVLATSTPLTIALPGIYVSKRLGVPMVFEVRDLWPELPVAVGALKNPLLIGLAELLEKFAYRNSAHIVALSPGMAAGVEAAGFPADRITVVPNGADLAFFHGQQAGENFFRKMYPDFVSGPVVVYAGTLGVINGVGYLVDIAQAMRHINSSVRFFIIGEGKESALLKQKALDVGVLNTNLLMLPPVTKNEMPILLAAATVATSLFIDLPEMWNNSANKFFDALAAGKPVMINYQGWQASLLEESGAGFVIPPDQPERAANILNDFIIDEQRVKKSETASYKLAETCFNRDMLAAQMLKILETVSAN